ncbi:MAG: hypothetical protein AB8C84_13065 [Oligoflexales bacterium]
MLSQTKVVNSLCQMILILSLFDRSAFCAQSSKDWSGVQKKATYICLASGTVVSSVFIHLWAIESLLDYYQINDPYVQTGLETIAVASNIYVIGSTKLCSLWDRLSVSENEILDDASEQTSLCRDLERQSIDLKCEEKTSEGCSGRLPMLYGVGCMARVLPVKEVLSASTLLKKIHCTGNVPEVILTTALWASEVATFCSFNVYKSNQSYSWLFDKDFKEKVAMEDRPHSRALAVGLTSISVLASVVSHLYSSEKGALKIFDFYHTGNEQIAMGVAIFITTGLLMIDIPLKLRALYVYFATKESRVSHHEIGRTWTYIHKALGCGGYMGVTFAVHYRPALDLAEKVGFPKGHLSNVLPALLLAGINTLIVKEVQVRHIENHVLHRYQRWTRSFNQNAYSP